MKNRNALRSSVAASLIFAPIALLAADNEVKLKEPEPPSKNRFGVSYRAAYNITAKFKNIGNVGGGSAGGGNPGPATGGGIDRNYDDGYNRVDSTHSGAGLTWNWAYKNASQIPGNDTVVMHSSTAQGVNSKTIDSDPEHGLEVTYNRELGRLGKNKNLPWGLECGLGWTDIEIKDHRPLAGNIRTIADAFGLEGIDPSHNQIPPGQSMPSSYTEGESTFNPGTKNGPGALIEDSPNRTIMNSQSIVTGSRRFDADLFSFRVGPYIDLPIDDRWSLSLSAGFAAGVIDGEFSYDQNFTVNGTETHQRGSASGATDVVYGGYVSASIHCAINERWGVFLGGQFLGLSGYTASSHGQKVEIDLSRTAFLTLGVTYTF